MFRTGMYTSPAALILNPTSYASGGTDYGVVGKGHAIGFNYDATFYTEAPFGTQYTDATIEGLNIIYEITLLQASTNLMNLIFQSVGNGKYEGFHGTTGNEYKLGYFVGVNETKKLLIRPTTPTEPHLYIPRGLVFDVGPVQWDRGDEGEVDNGLHHSATRILVACLFDRERNTAVHYGERNELTAITEEEDPPA